MQNAWVSGKGVFFFLLKSLKKKKPTRLKLYDEICSTCGSEMCDKNKIWRKKEENIFL